MKRFILNKKPKSFFFDTNHPNTELLKNLDKTKFHITFNVFAFDLVFQSHQFKDTDEEIEKVTIKNLHTGVQIKEICT